MIYDNQHKIPKIAIWNGIYWFYFLKEKIIPSIQIHKFIQNIDADNLFMPCFASNISLNLCCQILASKEIKGGLKMDLSI